MKVFWNMKHPSSIVVLADLELTRNLVKKFGDFIKFFLQNQVNDWNPQKSPIL